MNNNESGQNVTTKETENPSAKSVCCGIYGLQNKLKPEKWYIGQSFDICNRWNRAYKKIRCKSQPKLYNALLKYGYDGFEKVVLESCLPDLSVLNEREAHWVRFYNSLENGYNATEGGKRTCKSFTTSGWKHSEETKEKLSAMRLGKTFGKRPKEVGEKIAKSLTGIKRSEETKEKNRMANVGKTLSEEHKQKISSSLRGRGIGKENSYYKSHLP